MKLLVKLIAAALISLYATGCGAPSCKDLEQAQKDLVAALNAFDVAVKAGNKSNAQAERDKVAKALEVLVKGEEKCTFNGKEVDFSKSTEKEKKKDLDAVLKKLDGMIEKL